MDKKPTKKSEIARRQTYSIPPELMEFVKDERRMQEEATGYKVSESSIVQKAIRMLKEHREQVEKAKVSSERRGQSKIDKSAEPEGETA